MTEHGCQNPRPDEARARRCFTLVELLVAIAVIAVLAGLLIPALAGARSQAKLAVCTSNLRSQGTIIAAYAADYSDALPPRAVLWTQLEDGGEYRFSQWTLARVLAAYEGHPFTDELRLWPPTGAWRCPEIPPDRDFDYSTHQSVVHSAANQWAFSVADVNEETGERSFVSESLDGWERVTSSWRRVYHFSFAERLAALLDAETFYFAVHGHRHARESIGREWQAVTGTEIDNMGSHARLLRQPTQYFDGHGAAQPMDAVYWRDQLRAYTPPGGSGDTVDLYDREVGELLWFVIPK